MSTKKTKLVLANGAMVMAMAMAMAGGVMAAGSDATATANVKATVLAPIAITWKSDLNFGAFVPGVSADDVVIAADTGGRSVVSGGVALSTVAAAAPPSRAEFAITGDSNASFSIALPSSVILSLDDKSATMTVNMLTAAVNSTSVTGAGTGMLSAVGSALLSVGGKLTVAAGQKAGSYSNPSGLSVTVAYN